MTPTAQACAEVMEYLRRKRLAAAAKPKPYKGV